MLGSPAGPAGPSQRGLWPLASAPTSTTTAFADGLSKYGVYSLFPGGPTFGSALYSHASTIGRFTSGHFQSPTPFHSHKVSDSYFSSGYTFGAPTPPPGSPYSPIHVTTQLELLTKGYNSNILIQPPSTPSTADFSPSPKKHTPTPPGKCEDEKCCTKSCCCPGSPKTTTRYDGGCSRTNPLDWSHHHNHQKQPVNVKKEPGATPCQVQEVTTSASPVVKVEVTSPTQKGADVVLQHQQHQVAPALQLADPSSPAAGMAANTTGGMSGGGALLQCSTDDRTAGLGAWQMGGAQASSMSATPTLWQYPAPLPMEPLVPLPVPVPPVGFQLIRDPTTGGFLLLPTTGIEQLQQAVVWPSYQQPSSHVLLPPLPPPPLQLLGSASSDYLSTSTTLHQHTQTHSTRLVAVTTDTKRKLPVPMPSTFIKIETTDAATLDQTKTIQATVAGSAGVFQEAPLVATHLIYHPHPSGNLTGLVVPTASVEARERNASPVTLTPPPEAAIQEEEDVGTATQDASNQTDCLPVCHEEETEVAVASEVFVKPKVEEVASYEDVKETKEVVCTESIESPQIQVPEVSETTTSEREVPDLSGLELLSNSIAEYENNHKNTIKEESKEVSELPVSSTQEASNQPVDDSLAGLDLLCALAEQRIKEEGEKEKSKPKKHKTKRHHPDEPKHKKSKHEERKKKKSKEECQCGDDGYNRFKTPESLEEVRKFVASKSQTSCCKGDWPCMNEMELEMRMRLAELQRQYREKQKELSKLKPKKHSSESPKKKRKKSTSVSERSNTLTPPPVLDKVEVGVKRSVQELLKPPTLCAESLKVNTLKLDVEEKRSLSPETPEKFSSSKKRKVGRPKRLLASSGLHTSTETIVAKKPKKGSLVSYLLAAKEKLKNAERNGLTYSPVRYLEEDFKSRKTDTNDTEKSCKIRPKLKAEATLKTYTEEEEPKDVKWESDLDEIDAGFEADGFSEDDVEVVAPKEIKEPEKIEEKPVEKTTKDSRCILTEEHLEIDKLRVLTSVRGLFYAGKLSAVEPPDVYSITLDGERGNRPHIMSREEILKDAIVEVSPSTTNELTPGTRLCAYWSQQYRCLYPGSVAEPETPNPVSDPKYVAVEFDDGDNGTIAIEDIRLLPPDYPIIEYDPNPLLSLSKRRRRTSTSTTTTEERRLSQCTLPSPQPVLQNSVEPTKTPDLPTIPENSEAVAQQHRERKKLKKKKRDKLKEKLEKRKKYKCGGGEKECSKHRKHHKKHKKHHRKHHKEEGEAGAKVPEVEEDRSAEDVEEIEECSSESKETYPEVVANPEDEVTVDDIDEAIKADKNSKKIRDRQGSCESRSKMSAFLPARQLWGWSGKGYKRTRAKGRSRKHFYKAIQRGKESIMLGDSAVFLSTGRPDRPYIGRIESMWEFCGKMIVKVKWFYHPEETVGCPENLQYPGALFESPHVDENDVQTISHKCEVLPLKDYTEKLGDDPARYATIYDNNDIYYLAGHYDPTTTTLKIEPGIPFT